jgi:hypothetical protein
MLCRDCGKYFMLNALYHHHPKALKEKALKMYSNGMSMRAISRTLNIPLGTIFSWIKRYGRAMFMRLEHLWLKAREHNESVTRVVDEMWTYLFKRDKGFYKWVFTIGYRARIRNHGHSCFLCEIVIRSQFHTTYEPEA